MKTAITAVLKAMDIQGRAYSLPYVTRISSSGNPYLVLISCILSLRTQENTTASVSMRLFRVASDPRSMLKLSESRIARLIYPAGFYRRKARVIRDISRKLLNEFRGKVPSSRQELMSLNGVGPKTANLVLGLGFGIPAICVDTHVHRISNRLGWVRTATPEETEEALAKIVPRRFWISLNTVMVRHGQNICLPVSPLCTQCRVRPLCPRKGVKKWR